MCFHVLHIFILAQAVRQIWLDWSSICIYFGPVNGSVFYTCYPPRPDPNPISKEVSSPLVSGPIRSSFSTFLPPTPLSCLSHFTSLSKTLTRNSRSSLMEPQPLRRPPAMDVAPATVEVSNIPPRAIAAELFDYFDAAVGSVFACEIVTARRNWKSRGFGRVQFDSLAAAKQACQLSSRSRLPNFQRARLAVGPSNDNIVERAAEGRNRIECAELHSGVLVGEGRMEVFGSWERVRLEFMPERKKLLLFVDHGWEKYKLEVMFADIFASFSCCLDGGESNAILLEV